MLWVFLFVFGFFWFFFNSYVTYFYWSFDFCFTYSFLKNISLNWKYFLQYLVFIVSDRSSQNMFGCMKVGPGFCFCSCHKNPFV